MLFSITLLSISLSLDALGVGIAYGTKNIKVPLLSKIIICMFSILYSGAALIVGNSLSNFLSPLAAKVIGISILAVMGIWITIQALLKGNEQPDVNRKIDAQNEGPLFKVAIKSLGITIQVIKNPVEGDIDRSGVIDISESFLLGLALSVDAIGVGVGSALAGFHSLSIPFAVGLFQLLFLYIGTYLGGKVLLIKGVNKRLLSLLPGILLIFLALIRIR